MQEKMTCFCGLPSKKDCHGLFEAIIAKEFSDFRYGRVHRLTVDTYSLQHPDPYMISAKSFAAHLTGMCCAMEYGNDRELLRVLQQWLNGKKELEKPELLDCNAVIFRPFRAFGFRWGGIMPGRCPSLLHHAPLGRSDCEKPTPKSPGGEFKRRIPSVDANSRVRDATISKVKTSRRCWA